MASVKTVKETIVTSVTIELTPEEAQTLADLMSHIVGPDKGPRGFASRLWSQLAGAGFDGNMYPVDRSVGTDRVFVLPRRTNG